MDCCYERGIVLSFSILDQERATPIHMHRHPLNKEKESKKNSFMVEWAASIVVGFAILTAGILVLTVVGAFITWLIAFVR